MKMIEPAAPHGGLPRSTETFFVPAATESLFWRPRFIVNTPAMQHVPFLFWLAGAVRPRNVAVCGSGNGAALFALCQALDKLNITGQCLGIGFWSDGEARTVPAALRNHASLLYDDIVHWRCETSVREALTRIAPGSLDLLFIDAYDLPGDELPLAEEWLGTLRPDGVIVVHGELLSGGMRSDLLQVFADRQLIISFPDEQGLVVLARSADQPARLRALLEVSDQGVLPGEIGLLFRRLGQGHLAVAQQIEALGQNRKLTSSLSAMRRERDEALNMDRELREAFEARSRKLSELQAELFDRETQLAKFETEVEAAQHEASRLATELESEREANFDKAAALAAQLEDARQQHEKALADIRAKAEVAAQAQLTDLRQELEKVQLAADVSQAELERERKTRFAETAALTAQLEDARQQHGKALADIRAKAEAAAQVQITALEKGLETAQQAVNEAQAELERERKTRFNETAALTAQLETLRHTKPEATVSAVAQLQQEIQRLKDENGELSQRVEDLMNSTSWRVTAPMRKVKSALSRN